MDDVSRKLKELTEKTRKLHGEARGTRIQMLNDVTIKKVNDILQKFESHYREVGETLKAAGIKHYWELEELKKELRGVPLVLSNLSLIGKVASKAIGSAILETNADISRVERKRGEILRKYIDLYLSIERKQHKPLQPFFNALITGNLGGAQRELKKLADRGLPESILKNLRASLNIRRGKRGVRGVLDRVKTSLSLRIGGKKKRRAK